MVDRSALPSGTVTFVFTDIEGSTRLWEEHADAMAAAVARHDELARATMAARGGHVFTAAGDSFAVAFARADDAVAAAVELQRRLAAEPWPNTTPIRVRIGVHTGEATERDGDYFGSAVNRAARLMSAGHGGQILVSSATAGVGARVPGELVDLGEHRLKDLSEPLRVFQLSAPGLLAQFPALRSLSAKRTNLPVQRTSFVGRDGSVARLVPMLEPGCLVVLTGVGGGGKTRLALHAAALVSDRFADGVWFIELAAVRDPEDVATHAAGLLEIPVSVGMTPAAAIAAWVADRAVLLVLDNCEHVLDAAAEFVEQLVDRCPRLGLIATSREGLAVDGERILAVAPLDAEASVELFCDRAGLDVESLHDDRHRAIAELCGHLDGLPLALELAAARARSLPPEEIGRRLGERFRLLGGSRRARSDRHRTLRTAIDWSYQLLDDDEQELFCRLSVFVGHFGLDPIEAIAAGSQIDPHDVIDIVDRLVDKSMLVADTSGPRASYGLLESLRDYGLERLSDGDLVRRAHAAHHARLVRRLIHELRTDREGQAVDELDHAWADIRAAVGWAVDADETELAVELVRGLGLETIYRLRTEVSGWAERVLAQPGIATSPHLAELTATAAIAAALRGDFELADTRLTEAIDHRGPDPVRTLEEGFARSLVNNWTGRPELAYDAGRLIGQATDIPPDLALAISTYQLSITAPYIGKDREAQTHLQARGQLPDLSFGPSIRAGLDFATATVALARDPQRSRELFIRALATATEVRSPWYVSTIDNFIANIDARSGDPAEALSRFRTVLADMADSGNYGITGATLRRVACALGRLGRYDIALAAIAAADSQRYRTSTLPDLSAQLAEFETSATAALPPAAIADARARGQRWSIPEAVRACLIEIDRVLAPG